MLKKVTNTESKQNDTPCVSILNPCPSNHKSKEEAEICFRFDEFFNNKRNKWHYQLRDGTIITLFFYEKAFIEYYPKSIWRGETPKSYITRLRQSLDKNGFKENPLYMITALDGDEKPEGLAVPKYASYTCITHNYDDLFNAIWTYR
ncbi:MAG: hypothetical protein ACXAC7_22760 [Candidatus Hodarchaeales archaeon]